MTPRGLAHQMEGFRKSCLQGTLLCLATGRPCAKTPKARIRSRGSKYSHVSALGGCSRGLVLPAVSGTSEGPHLS